MSKISMMMAMLATLDPESLEATINKLDPKDQFHVRAGIAKTQHDSAEKLDAAHAKRAKRLERNRKIYESQQGVTQ